MTTTDKLVLNIDATALGNSGCLLAMKHVVIDGYKESLPGDNLIYGVAVHKFIDVMYKSRGNYLEAKAQALRAFGIPKSHNRKSPHMSDRNHMLAVCFHVWEMFVKEEKDFKLLELMLPCWKCGGSGNIPNFSLDGELQDHNVCDICLGSKQLLSPSTEVTFSFKYHEDNNIIVNLCGTIDRVGKVVNGCYLIRDWKTTSSSWDKKGYFYQYQLSRQLRVYKLALRLMAQLYPASILGQIGSTNVRCVIDAIFLKPGANDVEVLSSDGMTISEKELDAFQLTLDDYIKKLSLAVQTGYWPKEGVLNGSCERKFGKCPFWGPCSVDENISEVILKRDFIQKPFSPLHYNER